jgi:hypothetical protein
MFVRLETAIGMAVTLCSNEGVADPKGCVHHQFERLVALVCTEIARLEPQRFGALW